MGERGRRILVVEDEEDILELISYNLAKENFAVHGVRSGEEAIEYVLSHVPDLVLLDLMLPGMDGFQVCRRLKNYVTSQHVPVVIVTAKGEEADIVTGLELGADDYITKPFSPKILVARVNAVLRRHEEPAGGSDGVILRHGQLIIDPGRHQVLVNNRPVNLTSTEFRILYFLASRPGWVFTRGQIVKSVHETDFAITERAIDVQVVGLRKKLGREQQFIETVRGVGYRFSE